MEHVHAKVEELRQQYDMLREGNIPVDVMAFADIDLRLNMIPFSNLASKYRVEAALLADFSGIYIDAEQYDAYEDAPEWRVRRLRFTVAHEIGHLILHRGVPQKENFASLPDFARWSESYGGKKYTIEQEANEFAGRLLVPVDRLEKELKEMEAKARKVAPDFVDTPVFREQFCKTAGALFNVAADAISIRLNREGLWLS